MFRFGIFVDKIQFLRACLKPMNYQVFLHLQTNQFNLNTLLAASGVQNTSSLGECDCDDVFLSVGPPVYKL